MDKGYDIELTKETITNKEDTRRSQLFDSMVPI